MGACNEAPGTSIPSPANSNNTETFLTKQDHCTDRAAPNSSLQKPVNAQNTPAAHTHSLLYCGSRRDSRVNSSIMRSCWGVRPDCAGVGAGAGAGAGVGAGVGAGAGAVNANWRRNRRCINYWFLALGTDIMVSATTPKSYF